MATTLQAPPGSTSVSHDGEGYVIGEDGLVSVPDHVAKILKASHGFADVGGRTHVIAPRGKSIDDEMVTDDEGDDPSPTDFVYNMTQADMKAFLRSVGVGIPRGVAVRELRKVTEDAYAAELKKKAELQAEIKAKADREEAERVAAAAATAAATAAAEAARTTNSQPKA